MKIAFVGKGGSGKSTLSSLFARYLMSQDDVSMVVGLDTDVNQHFSLLLGATELHQTSEKVLGDTANMKLLKDMFRGTNPRIPTAEAMIKTSPPGTGSRLFRLSDHPVVKEFAYDISGIQLLLTGGMKADGIGVNCYHAYNGWAELFLAHTIDAKDEYIICDATAGTDPLSSGLFTRFDATFLVVEPTLQGVSVYKQYVEHAAEYNVKVYVIGNKIEDEDDEAFLREQVGGALLATVSVSPFVRAMKKGRLLPFSELESDTRRAFDVMRRTIDALPQNWRDYQAKIERLHTKNAEKWAGTERLSHIDPAFDLEKAASALLRA